MTRRELKVFTKIRRRAIITPDDTGELKVQFYNCPPLNFDNGFVDFCNVYDQFKVYSMKLKFIPDRPNEISMITGASFPGYAPIYLWYDDNSIDYPTATTSTTLIDKIMNFKGFRAKNIFTPWTYYHRFRSFSSAIPVPDFTSFGQDLDGIKGDPLIEQTFDPIKGDVGDVIQGQRFGRWYMPQVQDAMNDFRDAYIEGAKGESSEYRTCNRKLQSFHDFIQAQSGHPQLSTLAAVKIQNATLKNGWLPTGTRLTYGYIGLFTDQLSGLGLISLGEMFITYYVGFRNRSMT